MCDIETNEVLQNGGEKVLKTNSMVNQSVHFYLTQPLLAAAFHRQPSSQPKDLKVTQGKCLRARMRILELLSK